MPAPSKPSASPSAPRKRAPSRKAPARRSASASASTSTSASSSAAKRPPGRSLDLKAEEQTLLHASARDRVRWALDNFGRKIVLSSSFGAQSAVSLHLVTRLRPRIPVILVDTGYLFPETYRFIDELTSRLKLNLKVYRSTLSPAWQEARHGRLWEQGLEGIERYNEMNKVAPLRQALTDHGAKGWISGLRRDQSSSRERMSVLALQDGIVKIHPIFDWTDRDVYDYLTKHELPYHPLWNEGYISIGDWHTSHKLTDVESKDHVRFLGLKRECGLHENSKEVPEGVDFVI